jgi:predicted Fe-S protein YdhL (DUF1289 family)
MASFDVVRCPACGKLTLPQKIQGRARCRLCKADLAAKPGAKPHATAAPTYRPQNRRISSIKSPCIGTCLLFPGTQMCSGCFRTVDEVRDWIGMTDDERRSVMEKLPEREKIHGPRRLRPDPGKV